MSVTQPLTARPTLVDRFVARSLWADAALIVGGAVFTALLAQVEVPMWPVPATGQTLAVLLVGASLGAGRGAASLGLYLIAGVLGAPVFHGFTGGFAFLTSPTFGYTIGFVVSAAVMGWFANRGWDRRLVTALPAFLIADAVTFLFGVTWLGIALGNLGLPDPWGAAFYNGFVIFIVGDLVKIAIAAAALPLAWKVRRQPRR